ncbi:MAG: isoprenylcysteine carboxylmethyltransferase family protein [Thiotrichaceae bacterium]
MQSPCKSWLLVGLQFSLAGSLLLFCQPEIVYVSVICYIFGIGLGVWAVATMGLGNFNVVPDVKPTATLVNQKLPYRVIRHPMYSSVLLICLGLVFQPFSGVKLILFALLAIVLDTKAKYEERLLQQKFPEYTEYQARTRRFVPRIY